MPSPKTLKLEIAAPAQDDLRDIAQYTFTRYGDRQVDIYLQSLYDGMGLLAKNPNIGHHRDDVPGGYQTLNVEKHVLVFTVRGDTLFVARILHQSRDIKRHL